MVLHTSKWNEFNGKQALCRIRSHGTELITLGRKLLAQWDFQNKGKSVWTGTSSFVLEVPLRNLHPSVIYSVPCDRIVQRAYSYITRLQLVIYKFFLCSTNILHGLSAYNPQKLVVYCLNICVLDVYTIYFFPVYDFKFPKIARFFGPLIALSMNQLFYFNMVELSGLVKTFAKCKICQYKAPQRLLQSDQCVYSLE